MMKIRKRMGIGVGVLFFLPLAGFAGEELKADENTALLCHFNSHLNDVGGKTLQYVGEGSPTFVAGKFDKGISLGKGQLTVASAGAFHQPEGTIEMWLKPTWDVEEPGKFNNAMRFFMSGKYWLDLQPGPSFRWFSDGGAGTASYLSADNLPWPDGEWRHVAATWKDQGENKSLLELYVNGELVKSSDKASLPPPESVIQFGYIEKDSNLDMVFDELRISQVRRTSEQIKASYQAGAAEAK